MLKIQRNFLTCICEFYSASAIKCRPLITATRWLTAITCQLFPASFDYLTRDEAVTLIAGCHGADAAPADVNDERAGGKGREQTLPDRRLAAASFELSHGH